jgi:hypothetical protein
MPAPNPNLDTLGDPLATPGPTAEDIADVDRALENFLKPALTPEEEEAKRKEEEEAKRKEEEEKAKSAAADDANKQKAGATDDKSKADADAKAKTDADAKAKTDADAKAKTDADAAAAKAKEEGDVKKAQAHDPYKDVQLPPTARGQSAQAFATLKARAAQDLSTRDQKIADLEKQVKELSEKTASAVALEKLQAAEKELADLRKWKKTLDIEADPEFKTFDDRAKLVKDFIYSELKGTGKVTDEHIKKIESLGGPAKIDWEQLFAKLENPTAQGVITTKLAELKSLSFEKQRAIEAAKANVDQYVATREKEFVEASTKHNTETKELLLGFLGQFSWMAPQKPADNADEAAKKAAMDHNSWLEGVNKVLGDALTDDSPQMRAVLLAGAADHLRLKRDYATVKAALDGVEAKHKAEVEALTKQLEEATAKLEKLKAGSLMKREGGAPTVQKTTPGARENFSTNAEMAIDAHFANLK